MKFRCQNCAYEWSQNIKSKEERKLVICEKCNSKLIRFAGAGSYDEPFAQIIVEDF